MLGQKLAGRYQIISRLGGGAFGATFLALDMLRPGNPHCVVKQFKPRATDSYTLHEGKRLFDREAKILETLLSTVKASLRSVHGSDRIEAGISDYYLTIIKNSAVYGHNSLPLN